MSRPQDSFLILDFGSQYTQLIARRIRELQVYSEIHPYHYDLSEIKAWNPKGIILSGGPASVLSSKAYTVDPKLFELGIPTLGICYGMQLMCHMLGGEVEKADKREYGKAQIEVLDDSDLLSGLKDSRALTVWMSHGDRIKRLPPNFVTIAKSLNSPIAACKNKDSSIFALQFHPEVVHTPQGRDILSNFIFKVSKASPSWTMKSFIEHSVEKIKKQVGKNHVILGLSGGVDSSVAAFLLHKAIGPQLTLIFINNGLLRFNEEQKVIDFFQNKKQMNLKYIDASQKFLKELKGVSDPEQKRKTIGRVFIDVFEEEAKQIPNAKFLAQGTLYPDVIESVSFD